MKTSFYYLSKISFYRFCRILVIIIIFYSCTISGNTPETVKNSSTIIFVDKSGSVSTDSSVLKMNNVILTSIITEKVVNPGDEIIVSFIYEQTSNRSNHYVLTYKPPTLDISRKSSNEARLARVKHKQRLRSYNKLFSSKVIENAFSIIPSRKQTDVIGSIKKLSDLTSTDPNRDYSVYYFSDMIEYSDFRRMNFGNTGNSITSFSDAQSMAKKDAPRIIKELDLQENCLSGISEISVIFPAEIMHINQAFTFLPEYWNYIFKHLGVKKINYL